MLRTREWFPIPAGSCVRVWNTKGRQKRPVLAQSSKSQSLRFAFVILYYLPSFRQTLTISWQERALSCLNWKQAPKLGILTLQLWLGSYRGEKQLTKERKKRDIDHGTRIKTSEHIFQIMARARHQVCPPPSTHQEDILRMDINRNLFVCLFCGSLLNQLLRELRTFETRMPNSSNVFTAMPEASKCLLNFYYRCHQRIPPKESPVISTCWFAAVQAEGSIQSIGTTEEFLARIP